MIKTNPNWDRGRRFLQIIRTPEDLVRLWEQFGSYDFGEPYIEDCKPWNKGFKK